MKEVIRDKKIKIGIIAVPRLHTTDIASQLVEAGIKGILNYTPKPVNVPDYIYLEEYDMLTTLEKVAFYVKISQEKEISE